MIDCAWVVILHIFQGRKERLLFTSCLPNFRAHIFNVIKFSSYVTELFIFYFILYAASLIYSQHHVLL